MSRDKEDSIIIVMLIDKRFGSASCIRVIITARDSLWARSNEKVFGELAFLPTCLGLNVGLVVRSGSVIWTITYVSVRIGIILIPVSLIHKGLQNEQF